MKILFLCTGNSCRSILAEAVLNHLAPAGMQAWSAGSQPKGQVHPLTLKTLHNAGISTEGLYSKSTDQLSDLAPDLVLTVCDQAAGEACPIFFGTAIRAHWGLADPSAGNAPANRVEQAFDDTLNTIKTRIEAFLALPRATMNTEQLKTALARIAAL